MAKEKRAVLEAYIEILKDHINEQLGDVLPMAELACAEVLQATLDAGCTHQETEAAVKDMLHTTFGHALAARLLKKVVVSPPVGEPARRGDNWLQVADEEEEG